MENLYQFTSIGRTLDPRYPTNLAILLASVAAGIVAGLVAIISGESTGAALIAGIVCAASVFVAWALARELDPDHNRSAFLAAGTAFTASFFVEMPNFFALFAVVMLLRVVNRTVGPPAKLFDTLGVLVIAGIVIFTGTWMFGIVAVAALVMDSILQNPHRRHLIAAGVVVLMIAARFVLLDVDEPQALSTMMMVIELAVTALFIVAMFSMREVHTTSDANDERLAVHRVQAGMGIGLMAVLVMLWNGNAGMIAMAPLWTALFSVAVYRLAIPLLPRGWNQ